MARESPQLPIKVTIESPTTTNNQQEHDKNIRDISKQSLDSILTRLHAGYFRISLSFGAQVLLWKTLSQNTHDTQPIHHVLHNLPSTTFLLLWYVALCTLVLLCALYILRCIFYFKLVKAEFTHYVGVNYLFAPWISWLLLLQATPSFVNLTNVSYRVLWWLFVAPVFILDVKIYGQWFTTEKRFLSMVANPTSQISVIGNLVGAWAAARMGWKESAVCIFTLGLAHYLVVFITLYQRLSGANRFPAMLRPVFFLFVAAPSMASLAWSSISGAFDMPCRMLFYLSLFLFTSLICRPALFKKSMKRFNVAWWAYSFPLTFLALASAEYVRQVKGVVASSLMLVLSAISILVFLALMVITALNTDTLLRQNDPWLSFSDNSMDRITHSNKNKGKVQP